MGERRHHSESHGDGSAPELSLPDDHLLCNLGTSPFPSCDTKTNAGQTLAPVITLDIIKESILPMLDRLVSDAIPNIRFNVAKSYAVLIDTLRRLPAEGTLAQLEKSGTTGTPAARGQDLISSQILPNLEKLQQDDDVDVRYFATIAVGNQSERMETSP